MKRLSIFIFVFVSVNCMAQNFAIVNDPDGYVNVREGQSKDFKIIDTLHNGTVVIISESKNDWSEVFYKKLNDEPMGSVYSNRLKLLSSYQEIPVSDSQKNSVRFLKDSIEIIVSRKSFDKSKHRFTYDKESNRYVEKIDSKEFYGTDGGMPTKEYDRIIVSSGAKSIILPKEAMENLYEPNDPKEYIKVNFDSKMNIIYIQALNSDGAGGYGVVWEIKNCIYQKREVLRGF